MAFALNYACAQFLKQFHFVADLVGEDFNMAMFLIHFNYFALYQTVRHMKKAAVHCVLLL